MKTKDYKSRMLFEKVLQNFLGGGCFEFAYVSPKDEKYAKAMDNANILNKINIGNY